MAKGHALLGALIILAAGCGDGTAPVLDSGGDTGSDANDSGSAVDCAMNADGTACGEGFICLEGACSPSECGDGFLDADAEEVCDDGNEVPGDGCEPDCVPSCTEDSECDDADPCNGAEICNTSQSRCQSGPPMLGVACALAAGGEGVCAGGLCAPPGCGNDVVDGAEECDDGMNGDSADGCRDDCTFTCTLDVQCNDSNACNGEETCDTETHVCVAAADLECIDGDPCTMDGCDMAEGCTFTLIDGDGDGFAEPACTTSGLMGGDCLDSNSSVYPGAPELCDMLDNDCNSAVDDGIVMVSCLRDGDGDGYGNAASAMVACACPSGYIPPRADGLTDCQDRLVDVNEGQLGFYATPYCSSTTSLCLGGGDTYDYDCDGTEEHRWRRTNVSGCSVMDCGDGWTGTTEPTCGDAGQFRDCTTVIRVGGIFDCIQSSLGSRTQECR